MDKLSRTIPVTRPYKLPFESNKWGGASFDGVGGYINVTKNASINNLTVITIISTFKPESMGGGNLGRFSDKGQKTLFVIPLNKFQFNHIFSVTPGNWATSNNDMQIGKTQNVAVTYDNTNVNNNPIIYKDGILLVTNETSTPNLTASNDAGNDLIIGNRIAQDRAFKGIFYDYIYFAEILTQSEIQDVIYGRILPTQFDCRLWHDYRLGHARDLSGNNNHGTITGNVRFV